ncbi:hypothetical protein BB558_002733 [Smittium angustum]|uniref:HpcH/HpaI aldolase/citrate lyase domain-containing protein n=1 Tax=Smittium angustum TaxID=133377 RepID=A0A2U1J7V2_SMIAN|nr:hypothetical protein BB558_002733 [Smittium angustum]
MSINILSKLDTRAQPEGKKRIRRTLYYIDSYNDEQVKESLTTDADLVMYDLEDAVPIDCKEKSRARILGILDGERSTNPEIGVRINSVGSGYELEDLKVVLQSKKLEAMLIPMVEHASHIQFVSQMIDLLAPEELKNRIRLIAGIETSKGLMNLKEIAQSCPRLDALMFAVGDYTMNVEVKPSENDIELYYARSLISNVAHAYGLEAIDMVSLDPSDPKHIEKQCFDAYRMGFSGKQVYLPNQIEMAHRAMCPPQETIDKAIKTIKDFHQRTQKSLGSKMLDDKVHEIPYFKWAERVLRRARIGGVDVDSLLAQIEK